MPPPNQITGPDGPSQIPVVTPRGYRPGRACRSTNFKGNMETLK